VCGQRPSAEQDVVGQFAAAPSRQDRLRYQLDASVDGAVVGRRGGNADGGTQAGDGVDEMVGELLHVPVGTRCATVQVVIADALDDVVDRDQCLVGTGEFVHGPARHGV